MQAYVTGDMDYHSSIDAVAQGICIIDAGHYGTEYIFMDYMERELTANAAGFRSGKNAGFLPMQNN